MDTAARMPVKPVSDSGDLRVGDHVHQLLNLAAALVRAATVATTDDRHVAETVVVEDLSAGLSASSSAGASDVSVPE